ncbi:DNA polymerase III subunit delta' [Acanthopleuribacter pedis]|uniref:DNA polymerase III subunit delta n=1 Tax=Acanthopleuribacter pedis TaxID=442870 RepID=A0A8J7Q6E0_9BACT|nr:DNA polymerase III subunit delta' [Acanthopleuribacter pedis]MBO1318961.1 DNA polymerase III subunit delta' [Acanthopleuribacter pedis]
MFEQVYGHTRIKTMLAGMVKKDQLHHGLCFHGPAGIGKRLLAAEVAKAMLCAHRTGCGTCNHCRKFASGNHPDYALIEPDGNDIKVDQIRHISENLHFRPFEASVRMIVMDGMERIREEAANAFLKSLEEPPEYVYFILVTADLKALIPTIQSRCQKVAFQSLTHPDKAQILRDRFGVEETMADKLAGISFRRLETEPAAWEAFQADIGKGLKYLQHMVKEGQAVDALSELSRDKEAFSRFKDHLAALLRELAWCAKGIAPQPFFAEFQEPLTKLAASKPAAFWYSLFEQVMWLESQRRRNLNQNIFFNGFSVFETT